MAASHLNIGNLQLATRHPDRAVEPYGEALAIYERLARDNPRVTRLQASLASNHNNIGMLQSKIGHPDRALESYGKALGIFERLARDSPGVTEFQSRLAQVHSEIGLLQRETGHADRALESYGKALAIEDRLAREHPEAPDYASALGGTLNNMAAIDLDAKRIQQARDELRQAISWQKKALAANPRHPTYRQFLRNHLDGLVEVTKGLGDAGEARAAQRELEDLAAGDSATVARVARLAAVIRGEPPKDNHERLQLADRAYEKFAEKPLTDADRANLRNQARAWLEAELATWTKLLGSANAQQRQAIAATLKHWQQDTDLAGVRDEAALDQLPAAERKAWKSFWAKVDALVAKASTP